MTREEYERFTRERQEEFYRLFAEHEACATRIETAAAIARRMDRD